MFHPGPDITQSEPLNSMEVGGQRHAPADLPPSKRTGTNFTEGCVVPIAGLNVYGKEKTFTATALNSVRS